MWFDPPFSGRSLDQRSLVLSFDDGPASDTAEMASYLAEENIRAMFFPVGKRVRQLPHPVTRLVELGHFVGNHSENHLRLTDCHVPDEAACAEFTAAAEALDELRVPQTFYRPAYGAWNSHLAHVFNSHPAICLAGTGPVNWDIDGGDYLFWRDNRSADACVESYVSAIQRHKRGIVLFHEFTAEDPLASSRNRTFETLRVLIPRLRNMGYRFCSPEDIPDLKAARNLGLLCSLQAGNGKYAQVNPGDRHSLSATARFPAGQAKLRLLDAGKGSVRMETADGVTLWKQLEFLPLSANQAAFRTPDGCLLAYDSRTSQIQPVADPLNGAATFSLVALGTASPADSRLAATEALALSAQTTRSS